MSIERLFASKNSKYIYRLGPSIESGKVGFVIDTSREVRKIIVARCSEEDEGGAVAEIGDGEAVKLESGDLFFPNELLAEIADLEQETGSLFEGSVKLVDGDEGILLIQHYDSDKVIFN